MAHIGDLEFQVDKVLIAHSGESIANVQDCTHWLMRVAKELT